MPKSIKVIVDLRHQKIKMGKYNNRIIIFSLSFLYATITWAKIKFDKDLALNNPIQSTIDLTSTIEDKVPVTINPGRFTEDELIYRLPKVIQGTYEVSDFGNYIEAFIALDYNGKELKSDKIDTNSWKIYNTKQLDKITYLVNDTFDIERQGDLPSVFSPEGTNIHPDNYLLNLHGFIGYFDILKNNSYELDVIAPKDFKRSSSLEISNTFYTDDNKMITTYNAPRYFDITDNPMMYGNIDVEEFIVGDINVELSVYSPNNLHSANEIKQTVYKMMEAQKAYLGDLHTTDRYNIILFLSDGKIDSPAGYGALEHQKSTVTVLRENSSKNYLAKSIIDIVGHEFFHIITPLGIHSEDIHYFDYNDPTFSKHLWMYEGVTEYFAQHFQVYEGLVPANNFYIEMSHKINISRGYDDTTSFTEMSEHIDKEPFSNNYYNVYCKGALIGMCLDIIIREESKGTRSLVSLMKELSLKYGENRPFEDDFIINEITQMTYPSIGDFFTNYIEGNTPIPYGEIFSKVGLELNKYNIIKANENASKEQIELRNSWLNIN